MFEYVADQSMAELKKIHTTQKIFVKIMVLIQAQTQVCIISVHLL